MRRRAGPVLASAVSLALALGLAGCTASPAAAPGEPVPTPFVACPAGGPVVTGDGDLIPDLTLPCFTGGEPVALRGLGKPAVINLWASWCGPCRKEMPALQAFADEVGDRVVVLGINLDQARDAAAWAAADFGVSFPTVADPDQKVLKALGRVAIPVTLFVAADGVVRHVDLSGALTLDKVRTLASDHLGVST
jgi:thiol-disulfide isomerase/thioredoxin